VFQEIQVLETAVAVSVPLVVLLNFGLTTIIIDCIPRDILAGFFHCIHGHLIQIFLSTKELVTEDAHIRLSFPTGTLTRHGITFRIDSTLDFLFRWKFGQKGIGVGDLTTAT